MIDPLAPPPIDCIFWPGGTTDGVRCAGETNSYWIDTTDGDVAEQTFCDAHAPDDSHDASSRGFTPRNP